jgi:AcrR family transcriptional regulator
MQDIADESGIAKGTLYLYFKDRDELLQRVSHAALSELMIKVEDVFSRTLSFEDAIRELVLTVLRFFDERRDLYRVNFEVKFSGRPDACEAEQKKPSHPEKQQYIERLARYFEEHVENKADAPRLALFFSETISAVLFRRIPETAGPKLEDDAEFLSGLLLNGLSAKRKKS